MVDLERHRLAAAGTTLRVNSQRYHPLAAAAAATAAALHVLDDPGKLRVVGQDAGDQIVGSQLTRRGALPINDLSHV